MSPNAISVLVTIAGFAVIAIASVFLVISRVRKQSTEDLETLADTRGKRIDDLEARINELETHVKTLEGQVKALSELKAEQFAVAVERRLLPHIQRA
jgi:cell division protein FtsB